MLENNVNPAGLEPAIPGSVGRCLIHWATGPDAIPDDFSDAISMGPGLRFPMISS